MIRHWQSIALTLLIGVWAGIQCIAPAFAADAMPMIAVEHPWARATAPGVPTGVVYLTIHNMGDAPDRLLSASSAAAKQVEIHHTTTNENVTHMAPVTGGLDVPANGTVTLEPTGYHLMLVGLKEPLKAGAKVSLELTFAKAGSIKVEAAIEGVGTSSPTNMHDSMPGMNGM